MTQYVKTFQDFATKETISGLLLFGATILAVLVANSSYYELYHSFWHNHLGMTFASINISMSLISWINDGLMALFFLMIGLEIKRELILGELSSVQKASFPVVAAIGGMIVPVLVYLSLNPDNPSGFGIPMATDIAFVLGILMFLGKRVSPALKLFLVALAVVDDLGAVIVVATAYTDEIHSAYFMHAFIVYGAIIVLNIRGVKSLWPYLVLGAALWFYIHAIGIHATIAGVLLAFAIPIKSKMDEKDFLHLSKQSIREFEKHIDKIHILNHHQIDALENIANCYDKVQNPLVKLEHHLHSFSAFFIMPLFAFANAGVQIAFGGVNENFMVVLGVVLGLMIGKPVGIFGLTYIAHKIKLIKKPDNISNKEILAAGFFGGVGFTMSIFITHLAFVDESIIDAVKLGVFVASFMSAIIGILILLKK